jgi:hypothetical protein
MAAGTLCLLLLVLAGCAHHGRVALSTRAQASPDAPTLEDPSEAAQAIPTRPKRTARRSLLDLHRADGSFGVYLGWFLVPIGLTWLEAGSWTNEDATLIQRLNADANFGGGVYGGTGDCDRRSPARTPRPVDGFRYRLRIRIASTAQ